MAIGIPREQREADLDHMAGGDAQEEFVNTSGLRMLEYNVLVLPDPVDETHTFTGIDGIEHRLYKPDQAIDHEKAKNTVGTVVDVSATAFTFEHGAESVRPGDRVIFARFAGMTVVGEDGVEYLTLKDKSITGVFREGWGGGRSSKD